MTMAAWERDDGDAGHSIARWEAVDGGWVFHGTEVLVGSEMLSCSFTVHLDEAWRTTSVEVRSVTSTGERSLTLQPTRGAGGVRTGSTARTSTAAPTSTSPPHRSPTPFPIRRLADKATGVPTTSPVAWVDVPTLEVTRVEQTYERLPDRDGLAAWRDSDPTHGAFELTVDPEGVVVDYEGFARRVRP